MRNQAITLRAKLEEIRISMEAAAERNRQGRMSPIQAQRVFEEARDETARLERALGRVA